MAVATTSQTLAATRQWLEPAIYVLLKCGVTWREFSELARSVYVEVASKEFGKRGRPTNVSRTAMLTGLSRREVRKQRTNLALSPTPCLTGYVTKSSLLLSAWHLDPEFVDKRGKPRPLPLEGGRASFSALLKKCGAGDLRPSTLLKELLAAGAVRRRPDGRLEALQRSYIPHGLDQQLVRLWGTVVADVASTFAHNLTKPPRSPSRFERSAVNDRIAASALAEFRALLEKEGQEFLERMDKWLIEHQVADGHAQTTLPVMRMGAGVYHIQD